MSTADLDYNYTIPEGYSSVMPRTDPPSQSTWWDRGDEPYMVRGPNYLEDGVKIPSQPSAMEIVALYYNFTHEPAKSIINQPDGIIQTQHVGRKDRPFLFILNFTIPDVGNFVMCYARRRTLKEPDEVFERMLKEFIEAEDDALRNRRMKIIPGMPEGSWFVKTAVGNKPAILGNKLNCSFVKGDNCFEVVCDVGSSTIAMGIFQLVSGYSTSVDIELAFLFESQSPDELPERVLGGIRARQPNVTPPWWNATT